jgi:hypothetical protein
MGNRAHGAARALPEQFVSAVRQAKVPPQGFSEDRTGLFAHHFTTHEWLPFPLTVYLSTLVEFPPLKESNPSLV